MASENRSKRSRGGRYRFCCSCDSRINSEDLKIPEFSSKVTTNNDTGLILCADCSHSLDDKGAPSASTSSSSSLSSSRSKSKSKQKVTYNVSRPSKKKCIPKRAMNSFKTLVDWCIFQHNEQSTGENASSPEADLSLDILDTLYDQTPSQVKHMLSTSKQASSGKRRKQDCPKRILPSSDTD